MGPDIPLLQVLEQEQLLDGQQHKVIQAPADEIPVGTVPDAGEQLDHKQVEDLPLEALAVSAQGDIHILPEPAGKGHVPAPPEFGDGGGDVGVVEVLGEIESQHLAHANAHHGVAGKIKVELERVGNDAQPDQRRGGVGKPHERGGGAVRNADDVGPEGTDGVRQQDFFGEAEREQGHAILDLLEVVAAMSHMQLGRHVPVLDDGARDELGEHDDIRAEINDVVLRLYVPAVDVDGIGERLERIEADAQRQGADALDGGKACPQQSVGAAEHKVCVFEIEQHPQAAHKACQQEEFAGGLAAVEPFQPQTAEVVEEDESDHDGEKAHLAPAVKHEAAQEQNGIFELCRREIVQRQRDGEEPE